MYGHNCGNYSNGVVIRVICSSDTWSDGSHGHSQIQGQGKDQGQGQGKDQGQGQGM